MEICKEQFESEFERFCDAMDIDLKCKTEEEKTDLEALKDRLFVAMQKGKLIFDDQNRPVYTTTEGLKLTFDEPNGAALAASDAKKQDQIVAKNFAIMASMTQQHPKIFAQMKMRDLKVCQAIYALFGAA
jgi:ABC-type uncharacterized transport system ATPase subunit